MPLTLILLPTMDEKGFITHFETGLCMVSTPKPKSRVIRHIPLASGLYRITNEHHQIGHIGTLAVGKLSINKFHRCMGHINHEYLRKAVELGAITGIKLDPSTPTPQCEM
jgi:hypothetical protein